MPEKLSVNAMFLNEPLGFYALAALAPHVEEILLTDTGSKPEILETLHIAVEHFGNIKLTEVVLEEGGHDWTIEPGKDLYTNPNFSTLGPKLSSIRQSQHEACKSDYVWLLDGDEVYPNILAETIANRLIMSLEPHTYSVQIPFMDFNAPYDIRQIHSMGRVFKKRNTKLIGDFPSDMFYGFTDDGNPVGLLMPGHPSDGRLSPNYGYVFHYETMLKPNRKPFMSYQKYEGQLPEVFSQYRDGKFTKCYELIRPFGF